MQPGGGSARCYRDVQQLPAPAAYQDGGRARSLRPGATTHQAPRCEIDEASGNGDVTEIGDPKPIGHGRDEFPHKIRKDRTVVIAIGGSRRNGAMAAPEGRCRA